MFCIDIGLQVDRLSVTAVAVVTTEYCCINYLNLSHFSVITFLSTTKYDNSGSYDYVNFPDHANFISRAYLLNTLSNTRHSSSNACNSESSILVQLVKHVKDV